MSFDIIIATCDRPRLLERTIKAVDGAVRFLGKYHRIIIVDNGISSVHDVVTAISKDIATEIVYLESDIRNKCKALNIGVDKSGQDWLAFTDDDVLPREDWLCEAERFARTENYDIFGGRVIPGETCGLPRWIEEMGKQRLRSCALVKYEPLSQSGRIRDDMQVPIGANLFVRRSVFEKEGKYDEDLWRRCGKSALGCEDAEFVMRIRARGYSIGYCAESVVIHPVRNDQTKVINHVRWAFYRGVRDLFLFPNERQKATYLYLLKKGVLSLLKTVGFLLTGNRACAAESIFVFFESLGQLTGKYRVRRR